MGLVLPAFQDPSGWPGLLDLQILLFPLQASGSGPGDEPDLAFPVLHFPFLGGVVEFDVGSPMDLEPAKLM